MSDGNGIEVVNVIGHMKKKGSFKVVMLALILGIALLVAGSVAFSDKTEKKESDEQKSGVNIDEYKKQLTDEIERLCLRVDGVKSAGAVVFLDGMGGSIYAVNTQVGSTSKSEYVIIGSGSNAHALYIGESLPRLVGIGVVCDTGGRGDVRDEIALLLASLYGLPLNRVYVSEG